MAGDSLEDVGASLVPEFRSPLVLMRIYSWRFAVMIAALIYSAIWRDYRLALIGAGMCLRPTEYWLVWSDVSESVKAAAKKVIGVLRVVYVAYCAYVLATFGRGG